MEIRDLVNVGFAIGICQEVQQWIKDVFSPAQRMRKLMFLQYSVTVRNFFLTMISCQFVSVP